MYADYSVSYLVPNYSEKNLTIVTNFVVDATTVTKDTVKFFIVKDEKHEPIDYSIKCEGKNIIIELDDYPYEGDEFYLFVFGILDRLGRKLVQPYMRNVLFSPNIGTKLIIQAPENDAAINSKKIHVEVTILDDDKYTLKLIDNPSDIVIFSESDLDEVLELEVNVVHLEVATDKKFFKKEDIMIGEHEASSTNPYKVRCENIARIGNTLSFDLMFFEDQKYFIRARLESRENEHYFGSWSDHVGFVVKAGDPLNETERYMDEMLFTDVIFEEDYKELEVVSKTDNLCTDQEFYIEFNKPVKITKDMLKDENGLVLIGKGFLIRRDF